MDSFLEDRTIILTIQNSKHADQVIHLVYDRNQERFVTEGLQTQFSTKEICIGSSDVLGSLDEYAQVLSFLLETMSAAKDLGLPYGFQNQFHFANNAYSIYEDGDCRVLKRQNE